MPTYDLVLFGATGFTGRLVAEYLLRRKSGARLALAGRDRAKLDALRRELGTDVPVLVGDVRDPPSLEAIARETKAVCTTVGPYAKYGSPLVAACAARGTHYCDLTGEPQWIRRMIDAHDAEARRTGARIVHCCGFDSIPSDLGCFVLQERAREAHGVPCDAVTFAMSKLRGGASGGTFASMMSTIEELKRDPSVRSVLGDPYALNPPDARSGPDGPDLRGVAWDKDLGAWTGPFIMAGVNTRIVRRTNALSGFPYGRAFRYREVSSYGPGLGGFARAAAFAAGIGAFVAAATIDRVRGLLASRILPKPGEGPSREDRERGYFEATLVGRGTDAGGRPFTVRGKVGAKGDPGYAATAIMLGEAALCLALDPLASPGGVLTPAFAMGKTLVERLRAAGMKFEATDGG